MSSAGAAQLRRALIQLGAVQDGSGRRLCALFMAQPSRTLYPDYYTIIAKPVAISDIMARITAGTCSTVPALDAEIEQMVKNAQTYNAEGSQVYHDASSIWTAWQGIRAQLVDLPQQQQAPTPAPATAVPVTPAPNTTTVHVTPSASLPASHVGSPVPGEHEDGDYDDEGDEEGDEDASQSRQRHGGTYLSLFVQASMRIACNDITRSSASGRPKTNICDHCGRGFTQRTNLARHVRVLHNTTINAMRSSPAVRGAPRTHTPTAPTGSRPQCVAHGIRPLASDVLSRRIAACRTPGP